MLCPHLGHGARLHLMSKAELFLSHFHRCTVGPEVNGFDLLFSVPTTRLALCLQVTAGEWSHAMGVDGGGGESGRQREEERGEGIYRTEAGNDELRERPLIFHFDRLSSVRRQRRWFLCPERRHLLFVMQTSAFFFFPA